MQPADDFASYEPTVLAAMWRYRWIVVLSVALFAGLAVGVSALRPPQFEATANLLLEDPSASSLFDTPVTARAERFLAEQEGVLASEAVALQAVEILSETYASTAATVDDLLDATSVSSDADTNAVAVTFEAGDADTAINGANAIALAYHDIRTLNSEQAALDEANRLEAALRLVEADLTEIDNRIDLLRLVGSDTLDLQLAAALSELIDLRDRRQELIDEEAALAGQDPAITDPAITAGEIERIALEREAIRTDIDDLFRELQTSQLLQSLEAQQPALAALLQSQADELALQRQLTSRRNEARLEAELASSGVVFFTPASRAFARGPGLIPTLVIMTILGAAVGGGVAYFLAFRRRTFANRLEPESLLGSHLLAEIPDFDDEGLKSDLPVLTDPGTVSAEAFRFVAAAIDLRMRSGRGKPELPPQAPLWEPEVSGIKVLAVVSASRGGGKTVVTANTAIAAARSGSRVLVIDGDFSSQHLSRMLLGNVSSLPGITDGVIDGVPFARALDTVDVPGGTPLSVMGRGQVAVSAAGFFHLAGVDGFMQEVRERFDLVLIDAPPLLQVAYSGALVRLADGAVVVVRHGSDIIDLEELADRLDFTGTAPIGYVYNGAPLRRELAGPEGSVGEVAGAALRQARARRRNRGTTER